MSLVEHLEELRRRLFISLGATGVGAIGGWFLYERVLRLLKDPFCATLRHLPKQSRPPTGCAFVFNGVLDPVIIKLKVVVFLGLFIALPIVLYQLWAFIVPGLTRRERRLAVPFVLSSMVLFALGGLIAYLTLPKGLGFLLGFAGSGFVPLLTGDRFLGFVMLLTLAFGLSFEFPIVLIFLSSVGVVSSQQLRSWRRSAILSIAIFAAVITPSSDPYTMTAMMVPMYLFYEAAILVARFMKK
ncbi:MAG: twin-arginine translocase subunit TatC [Actinobacteria bacterium]|nr:twin-arginine translocase subunit TatC [Actinomycetota bacterium]